MRARGLSTAVDANVDVSPYIVDIPDDNITSYVTERCRPYGDRTAIIDAATGRSVTFAQLPGRIGAAAAGFEARGVTAKSTVAIVLTNCLEYVIAFQGIASLGATITTVNPTYTPAELAHQLKDSGASYIVTNTLLQPLVKAALPHVPGLQPANVAVIGEASGAFLESGNAPLRITSVDSATHTLVIPYSSGTTGLPKGVVLTHRNLIANVQQTTAHPVLNCGMVEGGVVLGLLPMQ